MAGGPSTPELAAAVGAAGGLGFVAAGYRSAAQVAEDLARTRALTEAPFGVNLFVPQGSVASAERLAAYAEEVRGDAERLGVGLGNPHADDDGWAAKLGVVERARPAVVSFTFGAPGAEVVERLKGRGILVVLTVTSVAEASAAVALGADALCVQGPEAGGHRATFDPVGMPPDEPLDVLLRRVVAATEVPVLAAGGLAGPADVERVLDAGAVAAQVGTAFLLADEAGTRRTHGEALVSKEFGGTAVTRAFSGRYARGLLNDFMRDHDPTAPPGYPEVNQLTGPLRRAAADVGDPHRLHLWAGTGFRGAVAEPAADIVAALAPRRAGR